MEKATRRSLAESAAKAAVSGLAVGGDEMAGSILVAYSWLGIFLTCWLALAVGVSGESADKLRESLRKAFDRPAWAVTIARFTSGVCAVALAATDHTVTAVVFSVAIFVHIGCVGWAREQAAKVATP